MTKKATIILSISLSCYCLNASALNSNDIFNKLMQTSHNIRQELVIDAQQQALVFAERPQVKLALAINKLSKQARANLEKRIKVDQIHKFEQAYTAVEEAMPRGLGWFCGSIDSQLFLARVKNLRALVLGNDKLITNIDKATKDFSPSIKNIRHVWSTITALYDEIVMSYEEYEDIEEKNTYANKALITNLKELKNYAAHADEIINNKITLLTQNRDLDDINQLHFLAEDLIEALGDRGVDPRAEIMTAIRNI